MTTLPVPTDDELALAAEAEANDGPSSMSWANTTAEDRPRMLRDAATTRANLAEQEAEATRPLTEPEADRLALIQTVPLVALVPGVPRGRTVLGAYLDGVESFLRRYVALPSDHEAVAIALWVAHAHVVERFETSPLLAVTSAEMRSGKTRVLDCLELLAPKPFRVVMPSEAVVYTILSQRPRRTMLLDEADAIFGKVSADRYEGLRAILNSGNRVGTPVLRVKLEGRRRDVEEFDVFGPKAIAGIGDLPRTVTDRAIPIRMKRRMPSEPIAKFRRRVAEGEALDLADYDWTEVPIASEAAVPEDLNDRAADGWEPLLAIAEAAGGDWPGRAWQAALALSPDDEAPISAGIRLLSDIRDVFGTDAHLPTAALLAGLRGLDDSPWADWYGKPLTARGLAKLLGPFRVSPKQRRVDGEPTRGYFRTDFEDAWRRYVGPRGTPGTSATSGTVGAEMASIFEDDYPPSASEVDR